MLFHATANIILTLKCYTNYVFKISKSYLNVIFSTEVKRENTKINFSYFGVYVLNLEMDFYPKTF